VIGGNLVGVYGEYLEANLTFEGLTAERKKQLAEISRRRGRDVLVFAADLNKGNAPNSIDYGDLLPINDQIENLRGTKLDLILESPGGSGEVAEDIIRLLRDRYNEIAVIVPGYAKSAATIMAMAADEILMGPASSLGPIDAQMGWQGKVFSAHALLEGFRKIKEEVEKTGQLNKAYIPILQGISPGELQKAENALDFARILVKRWLAKYKFKNWDIHSSTGAPVTDADRENRADKIAERLCNHGEWLTHGRSLKIDDLEGMKLRITDFSKDANLADPIRRYHTLLQMTFATNIYKVFETPDSQVYRYFAIPATPPPPGQMGDAAILESTCPRCATRLRIQANLGQTHPLKPGCLPFPQDNKLKCPACSAEIDLGDTRRQLEVQTKKKIVV
jgi:hypothetical protein